MTKRPAPEPSDALSLRERAEALMRKQAEVVHDLTPEEMHKLVHELHTHQIELEMQNEELRRAQEELIGIQERMTDLYDFAPVGYLSVNERGMIERANLTLTEMLGVERSILINRPLSAYIFDEDQDVYYEHRRTVLNSGEAEKCELRIRLEDGTSRWVSIDSAKVEDSETGETIIRSVLSDITEQRRIQLHEMELEQQLLQSQKLESLGTLASGIAHDFNNILQAILGYTEVASKLGREDEETMSRCLTEIEKGGLRARELVDQILTFGRKTDVKLEVQKLQPLLSEAVKFVRSTIPTTIRIEPSVASDCGSVLVNATQFHQVVTNLCANAAHAMEENGGLLSISLQPFCVDSEFETLSGPISAGDYVELTVTDTGVGMNRETTRRAIDPFFTSKVVGKGTGLGLAMVHGIIKGTEGGLTIDSEPGIGTTIRAYWPVSMELIEKAQNTNSSPIYSGRAVHILMVDDETPITELGALLLETRGWTVDTYNEPLLALRAVREDPNKYDLAIMDYTMPQMTGIELAQAVESVNSEIPIILMTGLLEKDELKNKIPTNIQTILKKPFEEEMIVQTINAAL